MIYNMVFFDGHKYSGLIVIRNGQQQGTREGNVGG